MSHRSFRIQNGSFLHLRKKNQGADEDIWGCPWTHGLLFYYQRYLHPWTNSTLSPISLNMVKIDVCCICLHVHQPQREGSCICKSPSSFLLKGFFFPLGQEQNCLWYWALNTFGMIWFRFVGILWRQDGLSPQILSQMFCQCKSDSWQTSQDVPTKGASKPMPLCQRRMVARLVPDIWVPSHNGRKWWRISYVNGSVPIIHCPKEWCVPRTGTTQQQLPGNTTWDTVFVLLDRK